MSCLSSLLLGTEMELAFDIPSTCSRVVTNRCDLKVVDHVFNNLDVAHKALFVESCFRPLLHILDLKLASQIIHHLLQRTLKSSENEKDAVWFKFGEKEARFGLQEFSLVSRFKIVHDVASYELTKKDLLNKFDDLVKKKEDADLIYKLGLITVLEHVVLSNECRALVDEKWFHLVENLEEFNSNPWGNLSYEYTVKLFKRKSFDNKNNTEMKYSLHGFPLAIMVWAFEALPELGRKFAQTCGSGRLPRILFWKMEKQLRSEQLSVFFNTSEVEVRRTLQPSRHEVQTLYLKEFRITEEEKIVPEDEEEEEENNEDDEEEEEEEEEKNDASQSDPPQP
ncbi:hypothetical protein STAS_34665 [Striga asiatica]|uniref:Uncharacterized protein n=1 Tax=Striga asiatica TaxID=4170 RepID=A0A5A7RI70_STRAF|nr:hypothetical protein STAS_34665 [Striga asiatica]